MSSADIRAINAEAGSAAGPVPASERAVERREGRRGAEGLKERGHPRWKAHERIRRPALKQSRDHVRTGPACKLVTIRWVPEDTGGACARCLGGAQASLSPGGGPVVHVLGPGELAFEVSTPALPVRARTIDGAGIGNVYLFRSNNITHLD